jgi:potassium/chloride transporter 4/5/6
MAGSNRSASLRDPQSSLPVGTLSAIIVTSTIYLVSVVTYGSVASREYLLNNRLMSAEVSWPATEVVQLGIVLSTLGAGLQVRWRSSTAMPSVLRLRGGGDCGRGEGR